MLLPLLSSLTAAAAPWIVDGTSLAPVRGQKPVASAIDCPTPPGDAPELHGRALNTLGVAVVAYSKKQGTMTWGHASLRALYCLDEELFDAEYEVYRLSDWNESQLREEHEGEAFADSEWLSTQRGRLALFRNPDPVDGGWFAQEQADNREIYELWLDLTPDELDEVTLTVERRVQSQLERLRAREDLERRYVAWGDNCTDVFTALPASVRDEVGDPLTPFAWVRRLRRADLVRLKVLYPSHHLVRRWDGALPDTSRRLHPLFRRRARLPLWLVAALHRTWLDRRPAVAALVSPGKAPPDGLASGIVPP